MPWIRVVCSVLECSLSEQHKVRPEGSSTEPHIQEFVSPSFLDCSNNFDLQQLRRLLRHQGSCNGLTWAYNHEQVGNIIQLFAIQSKNKIAADMSVPMSHSIVEIFRD